MDITPLENLNNLHSFYSYGNTVDLPTVYVSKELKTFILEQPVKYSSQFKKIDVEVRPSHDTSKVLEVQRSNNAIIVENLDTNVSGVEIWMQGSSEYFGWDTGFQSTMRFNVPIIWY
ncbi:hypothetical protein IGI37_002345 [Enterococcus sp. AZ194]|uniref:hypothetical protein n=1 Tax=Enterococcus sp. AZ194 TaxID=2774629 RepID=UPI003F211E4C